MEQIYRGKEISFLEHSETWICKEFGLEDESIKKLKEKIDKHIKIEAGFQRFAVYISSWRNDSLKKAVVTSITREGEKWVTYKDDFDNSRREKIHGNVYQQNEHNNAIVDEINKLRGDIAALEDKIEELRNKLQPFDDDPYRDPQYRRKTDDEE